MSHEEKKHDAIYIDKTIDHSHTSNFRRLKYEYNVGLGMDKL